MKRIVLISACCASCELSLIVINWLNDKWLLGWLYSASIMIWKLHVSWWNPRKPLGTIDDVQNTIARGTTRIGRNTDQSRIVMNNPKLSKVHVIIEAKKDGITVQDKGSSKGCKVWVRRLKPGIGYNLEYRQSLCLGGVVLAHFQALGRMWRTTQRTLFQRLLRLWNTQVLQW